MQLRPYIVRAGGQNRGPRAEPEIMRIKLDICAANVDGDKPEKRGYCDEHGMA